jgi:hypothetical protein
MNKNNNLGTVIHGIGASAHLDSSGERIDVDGIDISTLTTDGILNTEHKSDNTTQIIGKIIEAIKILKKEDCKNKEHEYFWEKAHKTPYLYIKAVLFDAFGHSGAIDCAAMLKFDKALDQKDTRPLSGFSIEGSRLDKEGALIKKCIARKISFTNFPCNKACIAEILEPNKDDKNKMISLADLKAAFKKAETLETDLNKAEDKKYHPELGFKLKSKTPKLRPTLNSINSQPIKPRSDKPAINPPPSTSPKKIFRPGDKLHEDRPKARTGRQIYNDPETWKSEKEAMSNSRKTIMKKTKKKELDKSNTTSRVQTDMMLSEDKKMKRKEILKALSQEAFDLFPKKEELLSAIRKTLPEASENEILAFAKTYAFNEQKKQEIELAILAEESSLNNDE